MWFSSFQKNILLYTFRVRRYSEWGITGIGKAYILLFTNVCTIFFSCNPTLSLVNSCKSLFSWSTLLIVRGWHYSRQGPFSSVGYKLWQKRRHEDAKIQLQKPSNIYHLPHITYQFSAFLGYLKRKMKSILLKILKSLLCIVFSFLLNAITSYNI